jgi:hemolysin D
VHPGQPALIEFNTYPYVRYGTAAGTVRYVSSDSFTSITNATQQGSTMMQQGSPTMPYYDARVTVDQLNMHGIPGGFHLRPGMPVTVQIKTGKRTVLEYLMERVLPVTGEGMREPS